MGIIGSIFGGIFGASQANKAANVEAAASEHAADLQKQAADQSLAFQKQQYGNSLSLLSPYYNTGTAANSRLSYLMGLNPNQGLPPGVINPNAPPSAGNGTNPLAGSAFDRNPLKGGGAVTPGGQRIMPFGAESAMLPRQNTFGSSTSGIGATGMLQTGPDGQPTGVTRDFSPPPLNLGNVTNATTNQGGTGQVPTTNPSSDPNSIAASGGFGSLAQGWGQTFQSPTAVTEQNDPGYQFRLAQGQKALEASAAARGGLLTGGTSKAINDYAQNSASNEYGNVYNRALQNYQTNYNTFSNDQANLFNRLSALSGTGQISANQLSGAGQNFANNSGSILMGSAGQQGVDAQNAAQARGSGYINQANAYGNMANNLGGALSLFQLLGGGA